ncbi:MULTISPECIES: aspartyl-phosphate phosphatase Spo0E family protein [Bacillaceae]|uniref:aspartyl-phosphate phosphatase Spo0E family protein n=1 Tax=Bacillaceae TaxID=186817 RepID=UPI00210FDBB9|nr:MULTISPECIES: aspartyl-phosphate phosphatase Spo0E family protein [Bacillaceae]
MKTLLKGNTLLVQIEMKRKVMYNMAKKFGYSHPLVVSCSQELDVLLNKYFEKVS